MMYHWILLETCPHTLIPHRVCHTASDVMGTCVCRHRKRGLAILPTKFGISFTFKPMNQAGALVSIFLDGSIAVAHGGVEMGQGPFSLPSRTQ